MSNEVHVTTSQADAAKMIVERNSANGKPTPEAIRKIADAQPEPAPEEASRQPAASAVSSGRKAWLRTLLACVFPGKAAPRGAGLRRAP
jgi:hypothetical protein